MASSRGPLRYLFWCANEHLDFRVPEFEAIAGIFNIKLDWVEGRGHHLQQEAGAGKPWVILRLQSEAEVRKILSRSVATRFAVELWGEGAGWAEMHRSVSEDCPRELTDPHRTKSFKIYVEAFMKKLSLEERLRKIDSFSHLPMEGPVRLKDPELTLSCFEYYGLDHNRLPEEPERVFFGRCVGEGQRQLVNRMSIKRRRFIGNTTMDPQLSLLMANLAKVRPADLVLDPFVGTGSLLLACAQFGGLVVGGDIDFLMLHARTRPSRKGQKVRAVDESMEANFEQLGLLSRYVDVVVCDSSRAPWARPGAFSAVVTDPPYGIREPTFKVGTNKENVVIAEEHLPHHVPQKVEYDMGDLYLDLMNFAATHLEPGGRLVYWLPVVREDYKGEESLPRHPSLKLVANCEQVLSSHTSRRLLVMEKVPEEAAPGEAAETVKLTSSEFRENFYKQYNDIPRRDRKERIKKYGHLNLKGEEEEAAQEGESVKDGESQRLEKGSSPD